jgi:AraC family transcriptional regulator, regulatory protein of adaptative response / methylated-DNA-[protein]-cysteine methyltransferase
MNQIREASMLNDHRWQAVEERQRAADGVFVYAVKSTHIYCRPSCPSRRPRRDRVEFFALPEAAERAGYRPCRRCRPERQEASLPQLDRVRRACRVIDEVLEEGEGAPPPLAEIAASVGSSPFHLQRLFKRYLGISPRDYADARRLKRVKAMLRDGEEVSGAIYGAGYGSSSRLYERSDAQLGMTPATYRKRGEGVAIRFATADSAFGRVIVGATDRGVCAVNFGDDDRILELGLRAEFPAAEIARDDAGLAEWVSAVLARIAGNAPDKALPLDLRATAFQRQVWQALQEIPRGQTMSYGAVAAKIGKPSATRAVARACATNPVAVVIPCHRVVREDGGLGGYRWGIERKEKLLAAEKKASA